jgi:hypothetical protein
MVEGVAESRLRAKSRSKSRAEAKAEQKQKQILGLRRRMTTKSES